MAEMLVRTKEEISSIGLNENVGLPDALRRRFGYSDEWSRDQESLEMRNEWLVAEREEVMQYVILLKKLAVYLAGKTDISTEKLSGTLFMKAEQSLPEYLRKEIEVSI